jgi:hypothetical protein
LKDDLIRILKSMIFTDFRQKGGKYSKGKSLKDDIIRIFKKYDFYGLWIEGLKGAQA